MVNTATGLLSHSEGDLPEPVGTVIVLTDADSANSVVTVDEVTISVESGEELLYLQATDPNITVVRAMTQACKSGGHLGY